MVSKKNGKIELLRFIFSIIIFLHHSRKFLGDDKCLFLGGSLAVEFFFIVSGFLMMQSITKKQSVCPVLCPNTLGRETKEFILKKVKAVYPESIIAWFIAAGVYYVSSSLSVKEMIKKVMLNAYELVFVDMSGIGSGSFNGVTWYISSMLLCMAILYPLIRKYPDFSLNVLIPVSMLLVGGYLFQNFSNPRNPPQWLGFAYKGTVRSYVDICMGVFAYDICCRIKKVNWSKLGRLVITGTEWIIYAFVIWYMYSENATNLDYFCILLIAIGVALTFSGYSLDLKVFANPVVMFLGKFSLPLYLSHTYFARSACFIFDNCSNNREKMIAYTIASLVTACTVMAVAHFIRRKKSVFCSLKKLLIED